MDILWLFIMTMTQNIIYIKRNGMYFDLEKETEKPLIPRALNELGITLINSKPYQPQGKGKVERKFLTFQR